MESDKLLSIENAAGLLGISTATVKNWIRHRYFTPVIKGKQLFFDKKELIEVKQKIKSGEIKRLDKRANKHRSTKTFIPEEYLSDKNDLFLIRAIIEKINTCKISISEKMFLLSVSFLAQRGFCSISGADDLENPDFYKIKQLYHEISAWLADLKKINLNAFINILKHKIPEAPDILGVLYQSLLHEGQKSEQGSYYTPESIIRDIVTEHLSEKDKALDPCCGTGQFLLKFAENIKDPHLIFGTDIDHVAVRIARINLILKYPEIDFSPNIFCKDILFDFNEKDFSLICTNPPWGFHFSAEARKLLNERTPYIRSGESFSYILDKCIDLLKGNGVISFILPSSILNVKTHSDIRKIILQKCSLLSVKDFGRIFKNVFTNAVRLDAKKKSVDEYNGNFLENDFSGNKDFIFSINLNRQEKKIIDKVYDKSHLTLKKNAEWALGIVTGDNKKFLSDEKKTGYEEIYKGSDIKKFVLEKPKTFIKFEAGQFQQCAPLALYKTDEKLIYRFISKHPVFAFDDKKRLTLNSANIVIPRIKDYPMKVICGLFNSSLYRFIYEKKFASIKVLKSHLEELPIPFLNCNELLFIENTVNDIIAGDKSKIVILDEYIFSRFDLSDDERKTI